MPEYEVRIVDAFTNERYAGNPCAVVSRAEGLTDAQMQAIARELSLSESAFVTPSERADFRVRFFTPRKEIPLAGHPTIATMHTLAEEGRIEIGDEPRRIVQELSVGVLPVDLERRADGRVRTIMTQVAPEFRRELDRNVYATALGVSPENLREDVPVQVVSTGTPQAMVPVTSLGVLESLRPDLQHLSDLEAMGQYFSTHVFTLETYEPANRAHSRHFAASAGIVEDPVTGSATGAMAAYLWRYGLLRERAYTVEQGHIIGRPGFVEVEVEGTDDPNDIPTRVRIAGSATTVLRGVLTV